MLDDVCDLMLCFVSQVADGWAFDGVKRNLQSWSGKRERVEKSWTKREGEKMEPKEGESRVCLTDWDFYQLPTAKEATSLFSCSFPALT